MKVFLFLINSIYWLWAFIVPVILTGIPAWFLYVKSEKNLVFSILLLAAGIVCGVFVAERIRRKPGLSKFFSTLGETPDIEETNTTKKIE
jgi:hypothetical protein